MARPRSMLTIDTKVIRSALQDEINKLTIQIDALQDKMDVLDGLNGLTFQIPKHPLKVRKAKRKAKATKKEVAEK